MSVSILNYGMGNIDSISHKIKKIGHDVLIISSRDEIARAEKLILPGVGHFQKAMENLQQNNLVDALNDAVIINKTPVLGICLGMQLMCKFSEEGNKSGLGWFDVNVEKMVMGNKLRFKVPHTGWNIVEFTPNPLITDKIPSGSEFYFVHSYAVKSAPHENILSTTHYETEFISGLVKDNIYGVQFHPEKSHQIGEQLINNFINL